jgi:hypothetical protein
MRLIFLVLLCSLFAPLVHADEWYDYIQVQCEPEKKVFEARSLRVPVIQVNGESIPDTDTINTPGEIYKKVDKKVDKISWTDMKNGDVLLAKDLGLNIPKCLIEESYPVVKFEHEGRDYPSGIRVEETHIVEFKVVRTTIDQGNVQRQCGAAMSAEFKVYVNDTPLGISPSARDYCFNEKRGSETVNYSSGGLKHCKYSDRMSTVTDKGNFQTDVKVCHEGDAASYLKYLAVMNTDISEEEKRNIAAEVKDDLLSFKLRDLYSKDRESAVEIEVLTKKNEALSARLKAIEQDKAALEAKLAQAKSKTFWERVIRKK